jgi:hypothetical protein
VHLVAEHSTWTTQRGLITSKSKQLTLRSLSVLILSFKIVKVYDARDEVIVRSSNFLICKAAFEKALFVYPKDHLEMRQGARIILKSKEDEPGS